MKVLYLYSELGPYNMPVFKELANKHMANLWVVSWSKGKIKPYRPEAIENVQYFDRSKFRVGELMSFSKSLEPDLVYVSGWMDKGYLSVARLLTKLGVPVVCGMDGIWRGGVRQLARAASFPLLYRGCFSHAWVAGMRQYEYAKRIGFPNDRIRFDLLTCDYQLFSKAALELNKKKAYYPRRFLYVGNFRHVKGTDILVKAYSRYRTVCKSDPWDLICIGNGELQYLLEKKKGIEVRPFASQATLVSFCDQVGAFVLPSRRDHWGVVVHEFAAAGLPL
jgi:glycosyltransferase involved in cell wall biosynthesis